VRLARAKVNLWLNVVGRRADGYHLLHSLVAFCDLADSLEAFAADRLTLAIDGPQASTLADEPDNLVLKAARLLAERAGVAPRAALRLTKRIPVAAGLGGGSADAAAALQALAELWQLSLPAAELRDMAAKLGADVPMCLFGRPAVASGVGEQLQAAPTLPPCAILLVNPGVALPTARVFAARRGDYSGVMPVPSSWPDLAAFAAELARRGNDLTKAAVSLQPAIGDVLACLKRIDGVHHAAMTGSGASCFALFDDLPAAQRAASTIPADWWRHAGRLES
jgi:4-diphosphocytidyl-2-C-methyl-D-erythritol kinase